MAQLTLSQLSGNTLHPNRNNLLNSHPHKTVVAPGEKVKVRPRYSALDLPDLRGTGWCRKTGALIGGRTEPHLIRRLPRQQRPGRINAFSDFDSAGCLVTQRSTSGIMIRFSPTSGSALRVPRSLSSAEAEIYGLVNVCSRAIGTCNLAKDQGLFLHERRF